MKAEIAPAFALEDLMHSFRLTFSLIGLALALAACGASEGGSCSQSGFLCADKGNALECKSGKWVKLPCRGGRTSR